MSRQEIQTKLRVGAERRRGLFRRERVTPVAGQPTTYIIDRKGWGFPNRVHDPERQAIADARAQLRAAYGIDIIPTTQRVKVKDGQVVTRQEGGRVVEEVKPINDKKVDRFERKAAAKKRKEAERVAQKERKKRNAAEQARKKEQEQIKRAEMKQIRNAAKAATGSAIGSEKKWHKRLVKVKGAKRFLLDGTRVAARWDDGFIFSLRVNPRAHMVEKIVADGTSAGVARMDIAKLLKQSRKYELDPMDIYENAVTHAVEGLDDIKLGKKKGLSSRIASGLVNVAFDHVPVLQQMHAFAQWGIKMTSPDSGASKWGEFKHNMFMSGPVETIAALPVAGPTLAAFIFGSGAATGGTAALLEGGALAAWTIGSFIYGQIYTPDKMEPAFDRVDQQVRYGKFGALESLFDMQPRSDAVTALRAKQAEATVRAFTEHIPNKSRLPHSDANKSAGVMGQVESASGFFGDRQRQIALGTRLRGDQVAPKPEAAVATPKGPSLQDQAALAQRAATTHLEWVSYIQTWAPRMIAATTGKEQAYWEQSLAYANQQRGLYEKALRVVSAK